MVGLYTNVLVSLKLTANPFCYQQVNHMSSRIKVFAVIALLGFIAGIIAQVTATVIIPNILPFLASLGFLSSYLISGLAGACLTVVLVSVWAYMTRKKDLY